MRKILPIKIDSDIITECWSYYRFAIIGAYPELSNWTIQRYNHLFADNECNLFYGIRGQKYDQLRYYNEIMDVTGYLHDYISSNKIVEFIIESIQQNKYVLFECDYSFLMKKEKGNIHELLIYGYDKEKSVFLAPVMNSGVWEEYKLSFNDVADAYSALDDISNERIESELFRRAYLYPITVLSVKKDNNVKLCLCSFLSDIKHICTEVYLHHTTSTDTDEISYGYLDGYWSCYNTLLQAANNILNEMDFFVNEYNYSLNIKKLLEYRIRFDNNIQKLISVFNLSVDWEIINIGREIIESLEICCMLSIKYRFNQNNEYIQSISDILCQSFYKEQKIIPYLYGVIRSYLINHY